MKSKVKLYITKKNIFVVFILFLIIVRFVSVPLIEKSSKSLYDKVYHEFLVVKQLDGNFYEMKNTAKIPYPWITARVDINRSNDAWENDVFDLMKKHGWKNHPKESKNLCKDGSKLILEQVVYSGKTYQFISLLHDDTTEDECK